MRTGAHERLFTLAETVDHKTLAYVPLYMVVGEVHGCTYANRETHVWRKSIRVCAMNIQTSRSIPLPFNVHSGTEPLDAAYGTSSAVTKTGTGNLDSSLFSAARCDRDWTNERLLRPARTISKGDCIMLYGCRMLGNLNGLPSTVAAPPVALPVGMGSRLSSHDALYFNHGVLSSITGAAPALLLGGWSVE